MSKTLNAITILMVLYMVILNHYNFNTSRKQINTNMEQINTNAKLLLFDTLCAGGRILNMDAMARCEKLSAELERVLK